MAADSSSVLSAFIITFCLCILCFSAFSVLRVLPWTRKFFAPRRFAPDLELKPKRLPMDKMFSWIVPTLQYREADIINEAGLDTAIYLRIIYYGVLLFLGISVWCLVVVLPANLTGGEINRLLAEEALTRNTTITNGTTFFSDAVRVSGIADGVEPEVVAFKACTLVFNGTASFDNLTNKTTVRGGTSFVNGTLEDDTLRTSLLQNTTVVVDGAPVNGTRLDAIQVEGVVLAISDSVRVNSHEYKFTDFDKYSLSNVEAGSPKMWAHLASMYFVVLYTLWLLSRFNRESVLLRLMFLGNAKRGGPSHTVLCTDVPGIQMGMSAAMYKASKTVRTSVAGKGRKKYGSSLLTRHQSPSSDLSTALLVVGMVSSASISNSSKGSKEQLRPQLPPPPLANGGGGSGGSGGSGASSASSSATAAAAAATAAATAGASAVSAPIVDPDAVTLGVYPADDYNQDDDDDDDDGSNAGDGNATPSQHHPATELSSSSSQVLRRRGGVGGAGSVGGVGGSIRYQYDLDDTSLDPVRQAKEKLQAGLSPAEMVRQEFELVYSPAEICAVNLVQDTRVLEPLVAEYNKLYQSLEDYLDKLQHRLKLRKKIEHQKVTVCGSVYGDWGQEYLGTKWCKKVDAVDFWLARLKWLKRRILEEQAAAFTKAAPTAFVTFNSRRCQAVGSTSLHHNDVTTWRVAPAPAPFEVVWKNLPMTLPEKKTRVAVTWVIFWLMTLFFMIPVAAIQAMIEVPKLAHVPVLGDIVTAPVVRQLMEGVIPGLVLAIFIAIVPAILRLFAFLSGAASRSEMDFSVVKRYFLFQVVVVFFGNIIAGSFFNQITEWIDDPSSVIPTLGKSIPMTSTFFLTYLLVNGLFVKTLAFIRLPSFFLFWLLSKFAGSPRARQRLWMNQYTDSGRNVADHTIAILIGLVFACMNPIVCLAALSYFFANFLGERYNSIYVFRRTYESGGKLWSTVYNQVLIALYLMQLTMFGLLAIKKFKFVPLAIPLFLWTLASHHSTLILYKRPWAVTSLHDAADRDEIEHKSRAEEGRQEEAEEVTALYQNPCFKLKLSELERLEALAVDIQPRTNVLNTWLAELKKTGRRPRPGGDVGRAEEAGKAEDVEAVAGGGGDVEDLQVPPEVTKYDDIPELDGTESEEAKVE